MEAAWHGLLPHVDEFVGEDGGPGGATTALGGSPENNVVAECERVRISLGGGVLGRQAVVHTHAREVHSERWLVLRPFDGR